MKAPIRFKRPVQNLPPCKLPVQRMLVEHPSNGPSQILYTTAPRPHVPLSVSKLNHRLWNPGSAVSGMERDESGRLAAFASRFGGSSAPSESTPAENTPEQTDEVPVAQASSQFDISWLDGETLQSTRRQLSSKEIQCASPFGSTLDISLTCDVQEQQAHKGQEEEVGVGLQCIPHHPACNASMYLFALYLSGTALERLLDDGAQSDQLFFAKAATGQLSADRGANERLGRVCAIQSELLKRMARIGETHSLHGGQHRCPTLA